MLQATFSLKTLVSTWFLDVSIVPMYVFVFFYWESICNQISAKLAIHSLFFSVFFFNFSSTNFNFLSYFLHL